MISNHFISNHTQHWVRQRYKEVTHWNWPWAWVEITYAKEVMFSPVSVCLSVCLLTGLLKTSDQIFMKFIGMVGHNPGTDRLGFGGNPDSGIIWRNLTIVILEIAKAAHHGFGNSLKIRRIADLRLNKLNSALAHVCHLRVILSYYIES